MIGASSLTPRLFVVAACFALGGLILFWAYQSYREQAARRPLSVAGEQTGGAELALREMEALFEQPAVSPTRYSIIAERNLFSRDRTAWAPPPPPTAESGPEELAEPEAPLPPVDRRNIRLYGTQRTAGGNAALLYFSGFSSRNNHRLVREGEVARDDNARQHFRLVSVARDSVRLADSHGREFDVGLYDHERVAVAPAAPQAEQPSIQVRGGRPAETPQPAQVEDQPADQGQDGQAEQAAEQQQIAPRIVPFGREPDAEMERLVEEGKMRRIDTPFGTIYRPVQ